MDPARFDHLARSLVQPASRRGALGLVGGAALALLETARGDAKRRHRHGTGAQAAGGGNSQCAHFCAAVFGADTPAAGQCTSDAAHGKGLCYQCGPANASKVCCTRNVNGYCTGDTAVICTCSAPTPTCNASGTCVRSCQTTADCGDPCAVSCVRGTCTNTPSLGAGAACGTGQVCSGGACTGNGVCTTGDLSNAGCGGAGCGHVSVCFTDSEGAFICAASINCATATFCPNGSSDCPPGFICFPSGCGTGANSCQPICSGSGATRVRAAKVGGNGINVAD